MEGLMRIISGLYYDKQSWGALLIGLLFAAFSRSLPSKKRVKKTLEQQLHFLQQLIDAIPLPVFFKDRKEVFTGCNKAFEAFKGLRKEEIIGKTIFETSPDGLAHHYYRKDQELFEHPGIQEYEGQCIAREGTLREVIYHKATFSGLDGDVDGIVGLVLDVTERKKAEETLRVSHRFLQIAYEPAEIPSLLKEFGEEIKNFTRCSAVGIRIFDETSSISYRFDDGFSRDSCESENPPFIDSGRCVCTKVIRGETDPKLPFYTKAGSFYMNGMTRFLSTVLEEEKEQSREMCHQAGYESVAFVPIRQGNQNFGVIHIADPREQMVPLDRVEVLEKAAMQLGAAIHRRRMEAALRESEERYRLIFEHSLDAILLTAPDGQILAANPEACSMFGYTEAELQKIGREGVVDRADPRQPLAQEQRRRTGKFKGQLTLVHRDGSKFEAGISSSVFRDKDGFERTSMIIHDLTERKRAEETLREEKDRAQKYLDVAGVILLILNADETVRLINKKGLEILGYKEEEVIGKHWFSNFLPERYRKTLESGFRQLIAGDVEPVEYIENSVLANSGQERIIAWHNSVIKDGTGNVVCSISSGEDITERRRAEQTLKETNQNFRSLIQASPLAIITLDSNANVLQWNPAAEQLFGWKEQEALGGPHPIVPKEKEKEFQEMLKRVLNGESFKSVEIVRQKKDGTMVDLAFSSAPLVDSAGRVQGSIGIFEDITERKRTERELANSRGQLRALAARIQEAREQERTSLAREIHDQIGQLLTGVSLDLAGLAGKLRTDKALHMRVTSIVDLLSRTIQSVRTISTELRPPLFDDFGLAAAIEWQVREFENRAGIECRLITPKEEISLDRERSMALFRIFQESLTNVARYANATKVTISLEREQEKVVLKVKDNGRGITKEQISDLKSLGILGMRERVLPFCGDIDIRGISGAGTAVTVIMPHSK